MCPLRPGNLSAGTTSSQRSSASSTLSSFRGQSSCRARLGSARRLCGWPASTPQPPADTGSCPLDPRAPRPGSRSQGCPTSSGDAGHVVAELPPIQRRALEAALLLGEAEIDADDRAVPPPSSRPCDGWPVRARSASRSTTSSGWTRLRARRSATRSPAWTSAGRGPPGSPRRSPRLASPRRARGPTPDGRRHRPEPRRDPRAAPRPPRHDVSAADVDQALGDLARQPVLRARARNCAPAPRRNARSRRGAPDPVEPRRAPARAHRQPRPEALDVARAVAALADPTVALLEAAIGARFDPGSPRRSTRGFSSSTASDVRFTHPLLGSAVVARQTPARRRSLHARLADVVPSAEERARHLALATAEPDRESPRSSRRPLERRRPRGAGGGRRSCRAGASAHAPLEPGRRPPAPARRRRPCTTAPGTTPEQRRCSSRRARALHRATSAQPSWHIWPAPDPPADAVALYREALSEAEADDALQATIHLRLAELMRFTGGDSSAASNTPSSPSRRLARRRRRAPLPCTRGLRPHALQRRTRHPNRGDGRRRSRSSGRWRSGRSTTVRRWSSAAAVLVGGPRPRARSLPGGP